MNKNPNQFNVESYCGIIDVYDDNVISFSMKDEDTLNVKYRINEIITNEHNISII